MSPPHPKETQLSHDPESAGAVDKPLRTVRRAEAKIFDVRQSLGQLGLQLRDARVARNISLDTLAQLAQMTPQTLRALESGSPGVSLEKLGNVLWALGMLDQLGNIASEANDPERIRLMSAALPRRAGRKGLSTGLWSRAGIDPSKL
jgi:transcriptional regulator with XRE-family HTH domain